MPAWFFSYFTAPCFSVSFAGSSTVSPQKFEVSQGLFLGTFLMVLNTTHEKDSWLPSSIHSTITFFSFYLTFLLVSGILPFFINTIPPIFRGTLCPVKRLYFPVWQCDYVLANEMYAKMCRTFQAVLLKGKRWIFLSFFLPTV